MDADWGYGVAQRGCGSDAFRLLGVSLHKRSLYYGTSDERARYNIDTHSPPRLLRIALALSVVARARLAKRLRRRGLEG